MLSFCRREAGPSWRGFPQAQRERFGSTLQSHAGSGVLLPIVLVSTLPFTALFLRVLMHLRNAWRDDLRCYLLLWFGFVFVFFSLSGTNTMFSTV
jgi:4-amino-4-deoxy-L-arabinose transferase-like glycosyltransferase